MAWHIQGQWYGTSTEGNYTVASIDCRNGVYQGRISLLETLKINGKDEHIWNWSKFTAKEVGQHEFTGETGHSTFHTQQGLPLSETDIKLINDHYPGFEWPLTTTFTAKLISPSEMEVSWVSKYPTQEKRGSTTLERRIAGGSSIKRESISWADFRTKALEAEEGLVYRGQARHWKLQTSFHRTGRADLEAYLDHEIVEVERFLNADSDHIYDIRNDRSLGALLNLAQHHGYPTPLLDWTRSPFVAAFFAYENASALDKQKEVTIFVFNERKWSQMAGNQALLRSPALLLKTLELPSYGNTRVLPQQSVTMFSSADDIEGIIANNSGESDEYIRAFAIPSTERKEVMRDLSRMGLSWGGLFPGLDGVCKQLRSKHFN
ncbi:FRG domain-containing protein [Motiliproteus coralliicola]|uniref:FRG domain-containing protein n=1 Tax=Motiliproteus coralliicola TaxID=2283196 RepID=A0A369WRR8_9GAMM|nr:FRG domain-containing protein [Motiliproteus coralliicola]RDE24357.1 FRG domain-containing protein [Motiliproteus coralliicola]